VLLQVEITTRCNFDCFYCAGRTMRQGDLPLVAFIAVLDGHIGRYGVPEVVSLQGEGEPTLHREFFQMAQRVRAVGATPYTITNGTYRHPERFIGLFPRVGVSVDSLEEAAARRIGRYNLPRVLSFIQALAPHLQIVIHSVAHGPHTGRISEWCRAQGYQHIVQPLQAKPDYSRRYLLTACDRTTVHFLCSAPITICANLLYTGSSRTLGSRWASESSTFLAVAMDPRSK
jgi:MoaA/NifB/PqqE/SkfB family radical SAM enzyme